MKHRRKAPRPAPSLRRSAVSDSPFGALLFGVLFGYFLSKGKVTDYDTIEGMFLFTDFHLYGVLGAAVAVVAAGSWWLRRRGDRTLSGHAIDWRLPGWDPRRLGGAAIFGAGWALAGTCPGPAFTQMGEGKLVAFFTVAGIFAGVWAYGRLHGVSSAPGDGG